MKNMADLNKLLTLVINLDRSPHRLAKMVSQLEAIGWPWERLSAADGKTLSTDDQSLVDVDAFKRKHGMMPLPGEVGCYLSHVWAMRRFLQTDKLFLLILEDDLRLGTDMPAVIHALIDRADQWDVVMLSGIHGGSPLPVARLKDDYTLAVPLSRYAGSSCYLLSRQAAEIYLRDLLPMSLPYDHEYDRAWAYGFKMRMVVPAPCTHTFELGSELNPHAVERVNFHWSKRLQAYGWRLLNEFNRVVYGLLKWVQHKGA